MQLKHIKSQLIQVLPYCRRNLSLCWKVQEWVTNCPVICPFTCNKGGAAKIDRGGGASCGSSIWTSSSCMMMGVGILTWGQASGTKACGEGCLLTKLPKSLNLSSIQSTYSLRSCASSPCAWSMSRRICSNWSMSHSRSSIGCSPCSDGSVKYRVYGRRFTSTCVYTDRRCWANHWYLNDSRDGCRRLDNQARLVTNRTLHQT